MQRRTSSVALWAPAYADVALDLRPAGAMLYVRIESLSDRATWLLRYSGHVSAVGERDAPSRCREVRSWASTRGKSLLFSASDHRTNALQVG